MSNVTTTNPAGLPATMLEQIAKGIAENRAPTSVAGGGKPLLRLLRDGIWVFGQENIEVQEGSHWAVNPMMLVHGWVCWIDGGPNAKNELAGEVMGPMWEPRVPRPAAIEATPFKEQYGCDLKCLTGDDVGAEVTFKTPSDGGIRAMVKLRDEIQRHLINGGAAYPCPVVELLEESYQHSKWGKIYKPILSIVGWCDMNGQMAGAAAAQVEPPAAAPAPAPEPAKPQRQRRAPVAPTTLGVQAGTGDGFVPTHPPREEPLPTQQVHTGQRRRPAAR
jgi:hypothetical protein